MKKNGLCILLWWVASGCNLFADKLGIKETPPKHDFTISGYFIKKMIDEEYYMFSKFAPCGTSIVPEMSEDTLTIDGKKYAHVFFARVVPKDLHKNFRNVDLISCAYPILWAQGVIHRKQIEDFDNREFPVVENVVGIQ